jgi:hypothetical protein
MVGPTFTWIIAEQFRLLRSGDRFFFTHTQGPGAAGLPSHLQRMIMKRTLGDILCETVSSLGHVQRNVFVAPDAARNPVLHCKHPSRARLDFDAIVKNLLEELRIHEGKTGKEEESTVQLQEAAQEINEQFISQESVTEKPIEAPERIDSTEAVEANEQVTETVQLNEEMNPGQDGSDVISAVEEEGSPNKG